MAVASMSVQQVTATAWRACVRSQLLGGDLQLDSNAGQGTTLIIELR